VDIREEYQVKISNTSARTEKLDDDSDDYHHHHHFGHE
jgi:hypothetical protein